MTKNSGFKKVVRRHAEQTGQRYTEALSDLQGLGARMNHAPVADRLLAHLAERYGIDAVGATRLSVHKTYVFRIDRHDGEPWIARAFPPARPTSGRRGRCRDPEVPGAAGLPGGAAAGRGRRCRTSTAARSW